MEFLTLNNPSLEAFVHELKEMNIKEKYLMGIVLSFITLILWCLLMRKKKQQKLLKEKQLKKYKADEDESQSQLKKQRIDAINSANQSNKAKTNINDENENDDGHLSDSALSFFANLGRQSGPRFRKRDKLYFYGKKMLRTVSHVRGSISANSAEKSKKIYRIFSKKILNRKNDDSMQPMYRRTEPPQFLLDTESYNPNINYDLPSALINLIRSVKVFGYFDQKIILEMCKYMEIKTVYANNYVFKIGDPDDSIYVVESGRVHVYITDEKGRKHLIKECTEGNHIFSLLSIMDVLIGEPKPYKTVSAKAVEDTSILRLPGKAFVDVLQHYPDYLVRITQIIIVRLQRVTFTALHNYLGLTSEMMRITDVKTKKSVIKKHKADVPTEDQKNETIQRAHQQQHHHHHHHHYHGAHDGNNKNLKLKETQIQKNFKVKEQILSQESVDTTDNELINDRKFSNPLPPISFFTDETDNENLEKSKALSSFILAISEKNELNEKRTPVLEIEKQEANKNEKKKNSDQLKGSVTSLGSYKSTTSYDTMDNSSEEEKSNGSEFGECINIRDLKKKLPQVEKDIAEMLQLKNIEILKDKINLAFVSEGTILCKEGDYNCSLMFVLDGKLTAMQKELNGEESTIFYCHSKQFCANLSVLSGEPALFSIKAKQDTEIAFITKESFHKIIAMQPTVVLSVAHLITKRMSPFVRQIDFALEWNLIESGNALFRQNLKAENIYIVLNGRLRSILKTSDQKKQLVGEYGRGDLVGIVEILMETDNATTVVAIRDTEVAQIPSGLLNYIKYRHPRVVTRLIQMLSSKLLGTLQNVPSTPYIDSFSFRQPIDAPTIVSNLCTVAIMPVSDDVPLHAFTMKLCHALNAIDSTLLLTKDLIIKKLGSSALERVNEYRLCAWLGQQEDHHRTVLYQCEYRLTPWTRRCMRQADCLLIVGLASNQPTVGQLEKEIDNFAIRAQKELILLHKMDGSRPTNTVNWLNIRSWCTSHHHIRCPDSLFKTATNERLIKAFEADLNKEKTDKMTDFPRLARFLTGTSIGVVLGGGGARGSSHVGMIKAMIEANIPIDFIGGTSIGSFMGALWAEENNYERFYSRAYEWSMKMTSYGKQIMDLTYPVTSMFTGNAFNKSIEEVFGNRQIEDLWIPYFCVTTDISASKMRIHMNGSLWRYVRSSMSLSGYLPPLCDPIDGHLLLDGGYTNNLPADVMHRFGVNTVLAIDVGSKDDDNFTNYGDKLSGWWLLFKKWYPWASPIKIPDLTEIQSRLAYVSCQRGLEIVKKSDYCEYLRPPIDKYRTLQFGSFEEILECGYNYGKIIFNAWIQHGGSIEKFLYKKKNQNISTGFSHKTQDHIHQSINKETNLKMKSFNNNYQFEDLSQFVIAQQQIAKLDSSLIKTNTSYGNDLSEKIDNFNHKKFKHSKSMQEENIYDRICDLISHDNQINGSKSKRFGKFKNNTENHEEDEDEEDDDFDEEDDDDGEVDENYFYDEDLKSAIRRLKENKLTIQNSSSSLANISTLENSMRSQPNISQNKDQPSEIKNENILEERVDE